MGATDTIKTAHRRHAAAALEGQAADASRLRSYAVVSQGLMSMRRPAAAVAAYRFNEAPAVPSTLRGLLTCDGNWA